MSNPLLLALSITLLSACTSVTEKPKVVLPTIKELTKNSSSSTISTKNIPMQTNENIIDDNINIQGNYTLERGQISFAGINKQIEESELVINKLNENDFGYYYTVKIKNHVTDKHFGIFHYQDGKFLHRIIADGGDVSDYDNIELIKETNRLKLTIKTLHKGKQIIIWDKIGERTPSEELLKAKKNYSDICKSKYDELGL